MAWSVEGEKKIEVKKTGLGKFAEMRTLGKEPSGDSVERERTRGGSGRDLAGGMELLELDFLLGVIESTDGDDKNDVTMRKLSFNELLRREQLDTIDSNALKVYAVNNGDLYGKDIQCEAMKKLTERTTRKGS
jgi:hypothetical protein